MSFLRPLDSTIPGRAGVAAQTTSAQKSIIPADAGDALRVRDLAVHFESGDRSVVRAVDGVSFDLKAGEALGILGESGSGKTTTLLAVLGLLGPNGRVVSGSCRHGETELIGASEQELQRVRGGKIGFVFQEPSLALHPMMRVKDQVGEIIRAHQKQTSRLAIDAQALSALETVFPEDVRRIARAYPHQLSGGQQQRVLIAQAMACRPQFLFADELTASLDACTQHDILNLLQDCRQKSNLGMLIVSHNPAILARVADFILVMKDGRVLEHGPVREIFNFPKHPYTKELLKLVASADGPIRFGRSPAREVLHRDGTESPEIPVEIAPARPAKS